MTERIIRLPHRDGAAALATVRALLEKRGYLWQGEGGLRAVAYQGGKVITRRRSRKLILGIAVNGSDLILTRRSSGAEGFVAGTGMLLPMRVARTFRRITREIRRELDA